MVQAECTMEWYHLDYKQGPVLVQQRRRVAQRAGPVVSSAEGLDDSVVRFDSGYWVLYYVFGRVVQQLAGVLQQRGMIDVGCVSRTFLITFLRIPIMLDHDLDCLITCVYLDRGNCLGPDNDMPHPA